MLRGLFLLVALFEVCYAHMLVVQPKVKEKGMQAEITVRAKFTHPSSAGPDMKFTVKEGFWVCTAGKGKIFWEKDTPTEKVGRFKVSVPSLCRIVVSNKEYFEPSERRYIKQIAKVYIPLKGLEGRWERPLHLKAEIVPLSRPFWIVEGETFVGRVYINGKPARGVKVEVEYLNEKGIPEELASQTLITNKDGYFFFSFPYAGWWGFSAIGFGGRKGRYPIELDAVLWVKVLPKPKGGK